MEMGIAQHRIVAVGNEDAREISSISGFRMLTARDDSMEALHDLNLPEDDQRLFEQGLHRGYTLIAARIDKEDLDEAVRVLEMFDPADLDRDSRDWLKENGKAQSGTGPGAPLAAGIAGGAQAGMTNTESLPGMGLMGGDRTISERPICAPAKRGSRARARAARPARARAAATSAPTGKA
jgi:hypothetical protein